MIIDTDILIDYLRGRTEAIDFLESHLNRVRLSAMSVAELHQGVREGVERQQLATFISALIVLPITGEIASTAGLIRRDWRKRCGCGLADCLIAATAQLHRLPLATLNAKHFPMIEQLETPYRKG